MSEPSQRGKMGAGAVVLMLIVVPLWNEFREPGQWTWNVLLAAMLIGIGVGALFLQRFLAANIGEVGEARFDTRNKNERSE